MRLLIEGIGAVPCLAVNLGCKGAIGLEGKVGITLAEAELIVVLAQILLNLVGCNHLRMPCQLFIVRRQFFLDHMNIIDRVTAFYSGCIHNMNNYTGPFDMT